MAHEELNELTEKVIGAAIAVHKALGPGFTERIYAKALHAELEARKVPFATEHTIRIKYKDRLLGSHRLDLVVADAVVVELKAVYEVNHFHVAQMLSYLKASGNRLGLILNFSRNRLEVKRVIR
jgi:GxxExxY protein